MATYRIKAPDGSTLQFDGPDGASDEQVLSYAQSQWKPQKGAVIPGTPEQPKPDNTPRTLKDRALGAYEAVLALASGAPASVWAGIVGLGTGLKPENYGTPEGARKAEEAFSKSMQANTYAPRTQAGKEMTEAVGSAAQNLTPLVGLPVEMAAISSMAKPSMTQIKGKALDALTPTIDPEVARLARKAQEYNIPLRPDQLGGSKAGKTFGKFAETDVPLAFSKAEKRSDAIHNAVIRQIDPDSTATRITSEVFTDAMEKRGAQIGDVASRNRISDTHSLSRQLNSVVKEAYPRGDETYRLVKARAQDLKKLIKEDGTINGTDFREWNTKILEEMRNAKDVKQLSLGDLQDVAMSAFEKGMSPDDLAVWKDARQSYAVGKQLIPLVAESTTGELNLNKLLGTVTKGKDAKSRMASGRAGEIGDIAKIAKEFGDNTGSISLPERMSAYALLNAVGKTTAGIASYPVSAAYNILGPKYAEYLTKRTAPIVTKPPAIDPSILRAQLNQNWLGDLTPDWTTEKGAAPSRISGIDPSGFVRSLGEDPPLPQGIPQRPGSQIPEFVSRPLGDLTPDWGTSLGAGAKQQGIEPKGLFTALGEDPLVSSRNKSRTQIPAVPGRPDLADVAINGGLFNTWTDAAPGALDRMKAAPMAVGGIELSRIVNMPKSARRTKLLMDFRARYPVAHDYIDALIKSETQN